MMFHECESVQRPALGRKLESLLNNPPPESGADPASPPSAATPSLAKSAGVNSLMRGKSPATAAKPAPAASHSPANPGFLGIPRWYLFGGDLLLVALALIITFKSPSPLDWKKIVFCCAVVAIGGFLAVLAVKPTEPDKSSPKNSGPNGQSRAP
jgi:hypothetical protein